MPLILLEFVILILFYEEYKSCGVWGSVVVKALRCKSDGPRIDSWWCHWGFFRGSPLQNHVPWGLLSHWKWVPGISPGVKVAGAYGWWPTTLIVPNVKKIWGLNLPRTPWITSACCGMTFTNHATSHCAIFPEHPVSEHPQSLICP